MQSSAALKAIDVGMETQHHQAEMQRADESHKDAMDRNAELHRQKLEHTNELAQAKKQAILKAKPKDK